MHNKYKKIIITLSALFLVFIVLQFNFVWSIFSPYNALVNTYTNAYNLEHSFISAVMKEESKFIKTAVSNAGARGLMQLMPDTAVELAQELMIKDFNADMLFVPEVNIRLACYYLYKLKLEFKGDRVLMLAAYNAGKSNVEQWLEKNPIAGSQDIPYKETKFFVKKVLKTYNQVNRFKAVKKMIRIKE